MLFFSWYVVAEWIVAVVLVLAGIFGLRYARRVSSLMLRYALVLACLGGVLLGSLFGFLLWAASGCQSNSTPIYSPSGAMAVRIENADQGGLGGTSSVMLYSAHGLRQDLVYWGPLGSVEPLGIYWTSDSSLSVHYSSGLHRDEFQCFAPTVARVDCSPRQR